MDLRHLLLAAVPALAMVSAHAQSGAPAPLCDGWYCNLGAGNATSTPTTGTPAAAEPGTGSNSAASTPLDTEATILDHLKNDPNYKDLFVKEPATSTNPCDFDSCIGYGSGMPAGPVRGTPVGVSDETALDYLKNNPAYAALLKDPAFAGGDTPSGSTTGQPSSGPGLGLSDPNCVSYYTYVCDKDLPGAKDNTGKGGDDDKKTPEEQATAAANSVADFLTGDAKDACEALMCLSTSDRPGECDPPIARYLSIKKRKASDTAKARADFLAMCPISGDNGPKLKP